MDYSSPAFSIYRISQARILEWVAISCSKGSSLPRNRTHISCISCIGKQILYHWVARDASSSSCQCNKSVNLELVRLRFMGLQRVGHDWTTELSWTELNWTEGVTRPIQASQGKLYPAHNCSNPPDAVFRFLIFPSLQIHPDLLFTYLVIL